MRSTLLVSRKSLARGRDERRSTSRTTGAGTSAPRTETVRAWIIGKRKECSGGVFLRLTGQLLGETIFWGMEVVELKARARTATATLPWDAVDVAARHRRARAVCAAPPSLVATYLPLAARPFARRCQVGEAATSLALGDVGLGLALDDGEPVVSVEAAALLQLAAEGGAAEGGAGAPPGWGELCATWSSGHCFTLHDETTGWRGCVAEHRLWSRALGAQLKTPHCTPTVRGWYAAPVLDDLRACVGEQVDRVAAAVAGLGFDGAPDLVLWRRGELWAVEVKSATDRLRDAQARMLARLAREGVRTSICCPAAAAKRMAAAALTESDED
jgi:hypothetical protein